MKKSLSVVSVIGLLSLSFIAFAQSASNFIQDPGFESGTSNFSPNQSGTSATLTQTNPLSGSQSLVIGMAGYGDSVLWYGPELTGYANKRSSLYTVSARIRTTVTSASELSFCGVVDYSDNTNAQNCAAISGAVGDKGTVTVTVPLSNTKDIGQIHVRFFQEGSQALSGVMIDDMSAVLAGVTSQGSISPTPTPTPTPTPAPTPAPTPSPTPTPTPTPPPPAPASSPIPAPTGGLQVDLSYVNQSSPEFTRFKSVVDAALAGNPDYGFEPQHAAYMYKITNDVRYCDYAITFAESCPNSYENRYGISCGVQGAESSIAAGGQPYVAGDSYLEVGPIIGSLALTYDWCGVRMTSAQRTRWAAYANQAIYNVWHPSSATWGGRSYPWTGWSIDNPGNNYYYSFLEASMYWALATRDATLLSFVRNQKLEPLVNYYAQIPGGGSLEGTGYGAAHMRLFQLYQVWKDSTGEDLSTRSTHLADSIRFWLHATTPNRAYYAPIGDLSRSSFPDLFDYHRRIMLEARRLVSSSVLQDLASWWLRNISVTEVSRRIDSQWDLLPEGSFSGATPNESLSYRATGVGRIFARTGWDTSGLWMTFVAGKYNESHAHQDQGSFDLANNGWLAVSNNIYSASGIEQSTDYHNVVRFVQSGSIVPQREGTESTMTINQLATNGDVDVTGNLTPAYGGSSAVQSWTRNVRFSGRMLRVTDNFALGANTQGIFQIHVPTQPVVSGNTVTAGALRIRVITPATPTITVVNQGRYRIDIAGGTSGYVVELSDQPFGSAPAPSPTPTPTPTPIPTGDTTPPVVSLTTPVNNASFTSGQSVTISASASDTSGIARVDFLVDGVVIASDTTSPYSIPWTSQSGAHTIVARAVDASSAANSAQASANVTVTTPITPSPVPPPTPTPSPSGDTTVPTASITSPVNNASFPPQSITISATASDTSGIFQVVFLVDGVNVGADTVSPYSVTWDAPAGTHIITAQATDASAGRNVALTSITVRVVSPTPPPAPTPSPSPVTSGGGGGSTPPATPSPSPVSGGGGGGGSVLPPAPTPSPTTPRPPTPRFTEPLYVGLKSDQVKQLQQVLITKGLLPAESATGFFGLATQAALQKYQCAQNIICSGTPETTGYGLVGAATRAKLNGSSSLVIPPPAPTPISSTKGKVIITAPLTFGSKHPQVLLLQKFLLSQGLLASDSVTGFFGRQTEGALQKYQCAQKLVCTGTPSTTGYGATGPKTRTSLAR